MASAVEELPEDWACWWLALGWLLPCDDWRAATSRDNFCSMDIIWDIMS
jgi:hypothetical protein